MGLGKRQAGFSARKLSLGREVHRMRNTLITTLSVLSRSFSFAHTGTLEHALQDVYTVMSLEVRIEMPDRGTIRSLLSAAYDETPNVAPAWARLDLLTCFLPPWV